MEKRLRYSRRLWLGLLKQMTERRRPWPAERNSKTQKTATKSEKSEITPSAVLWLKPTSVVSLFPTVCRCSTCVFCPPFTDDFFCAGLSERQPTVLLPQIPDLLPPQLWLSVTFLQGLHLILLLCLPPDLQYSWMKIEQQPSGRPHKIP